jgi:hypothetical protein
LVSLCVLKGEQVVFSKLDILKPSWTLRGEFIEGEFCLVKGKAFETNGENFILENAFAKILLIYLWLSCKKSLKRIYKRICKNKTCGASVVQYVKNKETIHAYLVSIYVGSIPSNLCTYIMQTGSIMHLYICFGLCWHQSPKRGRLKGN